MSEGLSATDVGKELGEHAKRTAEQLADRHQRLIAIAEAVLLSVVTIVAAWSGFSAAKWGTESSVSLARASTNRTLANRDFQESLTYRVSDQLSFNLWLAAVEAHNPAAIRIAARRFRPEYRPAFTAWLATHPFTNPNAPAGPQSMPQYSPTGLADSVRLDATADAQFAAGQSAASTADDYVRTTVVLASVLFLVGIGSHFRGRGVRIGLIAVGAVLLVLAAGLILTLPPPP